MNIPYPYELAASERVALLRKMLDSGEVPLCGKCKKSLDRAIRVALFDAATAAGENSGTLQ
jgi:hypothetical protein